MTTERIRPIKALAGGVALLAVGVAGGYWGAHSTIVSRETANPATSMSPAAQPAAAGANGKPLYWYDPMMPSQHFDKPGTSPMGMQMVPKYANEGSEGGGVHVISGG